MSKKRIMIIDDTPLMRLVVKSMVEESDDMEVVAVAKNGRDALEKLKDANPDLILTDIEMPEMDGLTFLKHARLRTRAKLVILSSVAQPGSNQSAEARRLGADAIIAKPEGALTLNDERSETVANTIRSLLGLAS